MTQQSFITALARRLVSALGAAGMTLAFFLLLPLIQAITQHAEPDLLLQSVDAGSLAPPPPLTEEEPPPPQPKAAEEPPALEESAQPLDLAQLELALDASIGGGWLGGDFSVSLGSIAAAAGVAEDDALFASADLDQPPRAIYQAQPLMTAELRKVAPATVRVVFVVDPAGRVAEAKVLSTTDSRFDAAALEAVKKWRYEPGKRNGQPVSFRVLQPITFPKN